MALSLSTHEPTEASSATESVPKISWATEYRAKSVSNGEAILESFATPLGSPSAFKANYRTVQNIYRDSPISQNARSASTKGINLYFQNTETWDVTDSVDLTYNVKLPVSCSISITIPENALITASEVRALINRTYGFTYDSTDRLATLIRGALVPTNL
jgi:hypothetical protein